MPSVDYFVATMPIDRQVEAIYPRVYAPFAEGEVRSLYGYKVRVVDNVGIGTNYDYDRVMVFGTGERAQYAMAMVQTINPEQLSVARIDVQVTMVVPNADSVIAWVQPAKAYKAVRWSAVGESGSTLYVGAPSSNARLRIYNKSAESGKKPDDQSEYLRVEVQLRNRYADQAYKAITEGKIEGVWQKWVRQMLHPDDASGMILRALGSECAYYALHPEEKEDWVARRKRWFEQSVVPAVRRLLAADPDYLETVIAAFIHEPEHAVWRDGSKLREMNEQE